MDENCLTINTVSNPPPDDITQPTSQDTMLMKGTLRAVGLNELLDFVLRILSAFPNFLLPFRILYWSLGNGRTHRVAFYLLDMKSEVKIALCGIYAGGFYVVGLAGAESWSV